MCIRDRGIMRLVSAMGLSRAVYSCCCGRVEAQSEHTMIQPQIRLPAGQGEGLALVFGLLRSRGESMRARCESIVLDHCTRQQPSHELIKLLCLAMDPSFPAACEVAMLGAEMLFSQHPHHEDLTIAVPLDFVPALAVSYTHLRAQRPY
eukprot:TRINITY_DN17177_c0_g1_i1.p1 TRINITY_DN17177_c0_g1~~TRINITY_DN17177_c0_g1_i1.p1  ORF type:complete len:149 (-),score=31.89 TRINITY_DN17177_c0_g1_i1:93-539(-)